MIEILLIAIAVLNFFLASLSFSKGFKSKVNFAFALFIFGAGLWPLSIALFRVSGSLSAAYLWDRLIYISGTIVPISFILFAYLITQKKWPSKIITFLYFLPPILLALLILLSDSFIKNITLTDFGKNVILGSAYPFWMAYFILYMSGAVYILWREFLKSTGLMKLQLTYILLAIAFPVVGSLPFNIILPFFGNYQLIYIGPFFLTAMVFVISYAIIRHRLMDIRLVASRTVAYSLLIIIVGFLYVGTAFSLSSILLGTTTGLNQLMVYAVLTVFVALSFDRLKMIVEKFTNRLFFKGRYNPDELLTKLGKIASSNLELHLLGEKFLTALTSEMKISGGALVILGENIASIYDVISVGSLPKLAVSFDQISSFLPFAQVLVFDELEENHLKILMRDMNVLVIKNLGLKDKMIGILMLGEKASGEAYSEQDLKMLEILSTEVAVAVQNSFSYDKIKKFNVILSEEVKRATKDLKHANDRLRQLDQLKDDFVSIASHELRTPMTAIQSYAWMALHKSDTPLSEKLEKYLVRILMSAERLINLVNDMLNVSRIESGRIEINPESVDLIFLARDIVDEAYHSKAPEKNLQIALLEDKIPKVFADPEKLREVFLNLLGNAVKFTPTGGTITIKFFTDGKTVETSIQDCGVGISKEDLSRLFTKFGKLETSYVALSSSGGTGLGLYISKSLIELMHGKIWAKSEGLDKGATFTFSLPVASPEVLAHTEEYWVKAKGEAKGLEPVAI